MPGKAPCWFEQVADEFERVSKDAARSPAATKKARELSELAEAIRADCGCGDRRDKCTHDADTGD